MRETTTQAPTVVDSQYPTNEWNAQTALYDEYWNHFDGDWLDEAIQGDEKAPRYPLKLNPYRLACLLHAAFLYGEVTDSNAPLVTPIVESWGQNSTDSDRDMAERMTDFLARVWYENDGRSIQQEAGIVSQILGGCVFGGPFYDPTMADEGLLPLRLDPLLPDFFYPVWAPSRYSLLTEAFICFSINQAQAESVYGIKDPPAQPMYHEHWTKDHYEVSISGSIVEWSSKRMEGKPLGGFVPYTYIPHLRVGRFYGESLLKGKQGMAEEINDRFADVGDIVAENARMVPLLANTRKITERRLNTGQVYVDIGQAAPGMPDPTVFWPRSIQANNAVIAWASQLLTTARVEAFTPDVVYGLDEGSQRSALTLAFRMIPLIVHIRQERTLMTAGLNQLAKRILIVAAEKKIGKFTQEDVQKARIWQDWAPVLPRDREQEVNEIILRVNSNLMSPRTALRRMADIRDIETELNLIKAWMKDQAEINAPVQNNPFGGSSTNGQLAGLDKPSKPQATLKKEN